MSEKEKKNAPQEEQPQANTTPETEQAAEKAAEELAEAKPAEPAKQPSAPKRVKSEQGIIVEGLDNCLVKFSKCCTPVPGDPVVGFITRGYGVSIHRKDCPNAPEMLKRFGYRIVKARWSGKGGSQYSITLRVIGNDDIGIVSNITNVISQEEKVVMRSISIDSHDGLFSGNLVVLIDDTSKLKSLIRKLNNIKGVKQVVRI